MTPNFDWRPPSLAEFIGQESLIRQLHVEIEAAKRQRRAIRHMLLSGPPGLGKTTLVNLIAKERGCAWLDREGKLHSQPIYILGKGLTHRTLSDILLRVFSRGYDPHGRLTQPEAACFPAVILDEIDAVPRELLESLHNLLDPSDPHGRRVMTCVSPRGELGDCWMVDMTIIGITNYLGRLTQVSAPTLSRFPIQWSFEPYTDSELARIVTQYALQLRVNIEQDAAELLASRSNGTPRTALALFKRVLDFKQVEDTVMPVIDYPCVASTLDLIGIDENGLDRSMTAYLKALAGAGGKMSIQALAGVLGCDQDTLVRVIEPVLIRKGYLTRGHMGREITYTGRTAISGEGVGSDPFFARSVTDQSIRDQDFLERS